MADAAAPAAQAAFPALPDEAAPAGEHSTISPSAKSGKVKKPMFHFEGIRREGRSASIIRDEDGHVVYPSVVPPPIGPIGSEGQTPLSPVRSTPSQPSSKMRTSGVQRRRAESSAAAPGRHSMEEPVETMELAASETLSSRRSSFSDADVEEENGHENGGRVERRPVLDARQRAYTMPTPSGRKRRRSDVALYEELHRTATILWHVDDASDDGLPAHLVHNNNNETEHRPTSKRHAPKQQHSSWWRRPKAAKSGKEQRRFDLLTSQACRRDGRLPISVKDTSHTGYLAKAVGAAVRKMSATGESSERSSLEEAGPAPAEAAAEAAAVEAAAAQVHHHHHHHREGPQAGTAAQRILHKIEQTACPRLNIVIMVIGSRGDAQPFLKIGQVLKERYGHRVRIATHPAFRDFIEQDAGLEFFSVGGDPAELMAFMVKNPGMIPTLETVKAGDIGRRRAAMATMFEGFWRACVEATDDATDVGNLKMVGDKAPFVADAIIANPPSFAHTHCAEALGIPLHLMFTFPYTPTQAFPHPLAVIKTTNVDVGYTNFMSYPLVDMMVWQGLGDLINHFRVHSLGLDPVSTLWAPGASYRMHVPFTYLWSPGLVPKPADWGAEIDIAGFVFLELAASFRPPPGLEAFLAASATPPVYIGFGSIVVDDADRFTEMIFAAVQKAGVRALVSKGWGGLGGDGSLAVPDSVYMLENTPHDWLFPQVAACVIHGGAGTTAMALKCARPTMVVPFFGDQHFWGSMIGKSGAGPTPVPYKQLTAENLAAGIRYCLTEAAQTAARGLAASIAAEGDGAANACARFQQTLRLEGRRSMRCALFPERVAVWQRKHTHTKLSALAADALVDKGYLSYSKLRLLRHTEWNDFEGPGEPITAAFGSLAKTTKDVVSGILVEPYRAARRKWTEKRLEGGVASSQSSQSSQTTATDESLAKPVRKRPVLARAGSTVDVVVTSAALGVGKTVVALAMGPIDMLFALCQGFHNAPRLYGDDTVRRPPRVTGIKSGLRAAGNELVFGVYDGVSGLVLLPLRHAREDGLHGLVRGVGMGLMGFVLKDFCALIGPVAYTCKGLSKQVERARRQPTKHVRRARMAQGQRDMRALDPKTRQRLQQQAAAGWGTMQALYDEVKQRERNRGTRAAEDGHEAHARPHLRRNRELDVALESAELAAVALAAVRRGEALETVVGRQRRFGPLAAHRRSISRASGGPACGAAAKDKDEDPADAPPVDRRTSV